MAERHNEFTYDFNGIHLFVEVLIEESTTEPTELQLWDVSLVGWSEQGGGTRFDTEGAKVGNIDLDVILLEIAYNMYDEGQL